MGRKKKEQKEKEARAREREAALGSDAKRSIAAIFLFALSILFLLAFIGQAGSFGNSLSEAVAQFVGWGRWPLIPLLALFGWLLLGRHVLSLSDKIKFVGLLASFITLLGLAHLFLGDEAKEWNKVARAGSGGGYLGAWVVILLSGALGKVASFVILFALFVSGIIAAFNVSLLHWFEKIQNMFREPEGEDAEESQETSPDEGEKNVAPEQPFTEVPIIAPENVQNIRFAGEEAEALAEKEKAIETDPIKNIRFGDAPKAALPVKRKNQPVQWDLPPLSLLDPSTETGGGGDIEQRKQIIVNTLKYFGIEVEAGEVQVGPTVSQYTFRPAIGVKLSRITTLNNDLALALAAHPIRIEAPIPGKSLIGIEVPNKTTAKVRLREILSTKEFQNRQSPLMIPLGKDVSGRYIWDDLSKMPHLLIAGATNSGKSVCINAIVLALLYQNSPEDLKFILVDPKRVELSLYKGIPHLKTAVIVDNHKVVGALRWVISEMQERYKILEAVGSRDLGSYKEKVARGEKRRVTNPETNETKEEDLPSLPHLIIIIDEMADLMTAHGKEVESSIIRLAQMSRAVGIHLILATQRPSVEVITGLIKANIPARIAFLVNSQIDSRTILDGGGAEKLLGKGDMLYSAAGSTNLARIQGAFIGEDEVKRVVKFVVDQKRDKGLDDIGEDFGGDESGGDFDLGGEDEGENDPIYEAAKRLVVETQRVSTTYLQTYLKIGYPKAARITELLEKNGVIGPAEGGRRAVLVKSLEEGKQYGDDPMADQAAREKW